jgi:hypothetical protein
LARHAGDDGFLSQAQFRQMNLLSGIFAAGSLGYNRFHFSSLEFRFLSHKRIPPRYAFSF